MSSIAYITTVAYNYSQY